MDVNAMLAFSYVLSPQDAKDFLMANSQTGEVDEFVRLGHSALKMINPGAIPENHKPLLVGYLTLYATMRSDNATREKLNLLLQKIKVSPRYAEKVETNLSQYRSVLATKFCENPISLITRPPEDVYRRLNTIASAALLEGDYKTRLTVKALAPQEYEHELDRMFLNVLQKTKGVDMIARLLMKHGVERAFTILYTGSGLRLGPNQFPEMHGMFTDACETLAMDGIPPVYLEQDAIINACAIGSEQPLVSFTSACFNELTHAEMLFVAGHELGHIKSDHGLYRMMASMISDGFISVLLDALGTLTLGLSGPILKAIEIALNNWQRTSELTADRAGLLCCQDLDSALRALMKMSGAPQKYVASMNVEAFKEQAREFNLMDDSIRDKLIKIMLASSTHPWTVMRGHELLKWYESGEYQRVLDRKPLPQKPADGHMGRSQQTDLPPPEDGEIEELEVTLFCSQCGAQRSPNAKFCAHCGNRH